MAQSVRIAVYWCVLVCVCKSHSDCDGDGGKAGRCRVVTAAVPRSRRTDALKLYASGWSVKCTDAQKG